MKSIIAISLSLLVFSNFFCSCKKENQFEATQTDFNTEEIYKAESDGFLTVHYKVSGIGTGAWVNIYNDESSDPTTLRTEMGATGSSTLAIHKKEYWKVVKGSEGTVKIEFTPFQ